MNALRLLGPYRSDDPLAWRNGQSISCATFLNHVVQCQEKLPDKRHVINLCADRYRFLVGFAAALLRQQITLLPPNRSPGVIEHIGGVNRSCYTMTDSEERVEGLESFSLHELHSHKASTIDNPVIPGHQTAVMAFTSGSTGIPQPHAKTWESLVQVAQKTGYAILTAKKDIKNIVATVPPQHMYGLETSIMLPIQLGWSFHAGRPFYPEDIRSALMEIPAKRILVSTPIHLRACLMEQTQLPDLQYVVSATAPLSKKLARDVENIFQTQIIEIYGFAEVGTIATRRTVTGESWKLLEGLVLSGKSGEHSVKTPYFPNPIPIPDSITPRNAQQFDLQGRPDNLIKIGGHRASLDDLNYHLTGIEGVIDGVFFMPDGQEPGVTRLVAFAVAPGKPPEAILSSLKNKIDPVFLPRPLYLVDALPRNPTGKLQKAVLETLAANLANQQGKGKRRSDQ